MPRTLQDAIFATRQLLSEHPGLLEDRLEPHASFEGQAANAACGIRVHKQEGGRPSVEAAVAASAAATAGQNHYPIVVDTVPADVIDSLRTEDGTPKSADRLMRGLLLRYPVRACIILVDGLNHCWKRFTLCKELCHVLLGQAHDFETREIETQLRQAFTIARDPAPDRILNGEELAWFAAIELILPEQDRPAIIARRAAGEDSLSIAQSYHVPKAIVDLLLESNYLAFCEKV